MKGETRVVVWFSCGVASACAAKLAVDKYGEGCTIVYCDLLASEHPDNARFLSDVERWIGRPITIIKSSRYSDITEVFAHRKYMAGPKGAPCTVEMKKVPRFAFQRPDDIHIFGLTADEGKRIREFETNNPELSVEWNLRDARMKKKDCYAMIARADITLPVMYLLGFDHNNCLGCVKATSAAYWNMVRRHFPSVFRDRAVQSRELGVRLVRYTGERIFLDELPNNFDGSVQEDIECGPICTSPHQGGSDERE